MSGQKPEDYPTFEGCRDKFQPTVTLGISEREELERFRNGFQGSCYACELVGMKNQELLARVKELEKTLLQRPKGTDLITWRDKGKPNA